MPSQMAAVGVAVVGLAAFLLLGVYMVDASIQTSRHDVQITNESFTPTAGSVSSFDSSDLPRADYDSAVTVRNATSGAVLVESGNYTWFPGNGTLKTLVGGDLAGTSEATVTYGYEGQELRQTRLTSIITELFGGIVPIAFIGFVAMAMVATAVLGRVA